jgi:hypothetical protein
MFVKVEVFERGIGKVESTLEQSKMESLIPFMQVYPKVFVSKDNEKLLRKKVMTNELLC